MNAIHDDTSVMAFAAAILHGDDEHRAWLLEAATAFTQGKTLPAPRGGPNRASAVPPGWKLVPEHPTDEMLEAATLGGSFRTRSYRELGAVKQDIRGAYRTMLNNAPTPPCSPDCDAVEAERNRCLAILALRANIWREAVQNDVHSPCAMSLWEECEDIAAAINNGLSPTQSSGQGTHSEP